MKIIGVKFSEAQILKMEDAVDVVGIDKSKIARAAMRLGIQQILAMAGKDVIKAKELVLINEAKSKLQA